MGLLRLSASAFSTHTGQQSSCHRAMDGLGEVFVTSGGTHGGRLCPDVQLLERHIRKVRSVYGRQSSPGGLLFFHITSGLFSILSSLPSLCFLSPCRSSHK